ncbi:hypothetical protein KKG46_05235 [Patescibacteria group bacterium]|nr:hypothetical protein [Patescibacteria group bacterium]
MKFQSLYIASWTPSSTIHLKEFYRALTYWESNNYKRKDIKPWVKGMELEEIHYRPEAINFIEGRFVNDVFFRVLEDGMVLAGIGIKDLNKDVQRLEQFLETKLINLWDNLFSRGTNLPKVFEDVKAIKPRLVVISEANTNDLEEVFNSLKVIPYKKISIEKGDVWIGESLVVVNNNQFTKEQVENMVEHLLFAREYELQLERLITAYHLLWNKVEGIRSQKFVQASELSRSHDLIVNIQSQTNFFVARLNQMRQFLYWREELIDEYIVDKDLNRTFKHFFMSLRSSQNYMQESWKMLSNYVISTVNLITFLYSDSERKNLAALQKMFLINVVSSIIALGALKQIFLESTVIFAFLSITIAAVFYYFIFVLFGKYRRIEIFKKDIKLEEKK